jgi:hypothetical protein
MSSTFGGSRSSAELPVVIAGARHPNRWPEVGIQHESTARLHVDLLFV